MKRKRMHRPWQQEIPRGCDNNNRIFVCRLPGKVLAEKIPIYLPCGNIRPQMGQTRCFGHLYLMGISNIFTMYIVYITQYLLKWQKKNSFI